MTFLTKVSTFAQEMNLIKNGGRILIGLSGGADSVALLCVLCELRERFSLQLAAVHVNHMLRENAGRDEAFSKKLCKEKQIPFYSKKTDIRRISKEQNLSLEEAGRKERYRIFHKYMRKLSFDQIATAHHMDDAAETVLLRILRGCGPDGLSGIKAIREDGVIRPLLCVSKQEIYDYLKEQSQDFVEDETNQSLDYDRNKIRNSLLPLLEREYNPNIRDLLIRLSRLAQEDSQTLENLSKEQAKQICKQENDGALCIDAAGLLKLGKSIGTRILRMETLRCFGQKLSYIQAEEIWRLASKQSGKQLSLSGGIAVQMVYGEMKIMSSQEQGNGFCYSVADGFDIFFPETGYHIKAEKSDHKAEGKNRLSLPLGGNVTVRSRKNADRMEIPQIGGTKKLKDIFIDKKIPRQLRDVWPFVTYNEEIIWMAGYYKKELALQSQQYITITIEKQERNNDDA